MTHIGYYPDAKYHYRVREEGAPEHILIYCEKGKNTSPSAWATTTRSTSPKRSAKRWS
jgi:hypothetical protein